MEIEWAGPLGIPSGYGTASMHYVTALREEGVSLRCTSLDTMYMYKWMEELKDADLTNPIKVTHAIPTMVDGQLGEACYTVFEFHQAPEEWERKLKDVQFVFTPSEYSARSLATVCDRDKIKIVPHGVSPEFNPWGARAEFSLRPSINWKGKLKMPSFKFLSVLEWVKRKCADVLIQAFREEFDRDEDACLILKAHHGSTPVRRLIKKMAGKSNIYHLDQFVTDMSNLYRGADCYISVGPEGWGETLSEAMACGVPTIGPGWSGTTEFMNESNSILVRPGPVEPIKYNNLEGIVRPWFTYQRPTVKSVRKAMRWVFSSTTEDEVKDTIAQMTAEATRISERFTWQNAARTMIRYLEEL